MGLGRLNKSNAFYGEQALIASDIAALDLGYGADEKYVIAFAQLSDALFMVFFSGSNLSDSQQASVVDVIDTRLGGGQSRYIVHGKANVDNALVRALDAAAKVRLASGGKKFKWVNYNIGCAEKKAITYAMDSGQTLLTLTPFKLKHGNKYMGNYERTDPCPTCGFCISWYEKQ